MHKISYESDTYYIIDRNYYYFKVLYKIDLIEPLFNVKAILFKLSQRSKSDEYIRYPFRFRRLTIYKYSKDYLIKIQKIRVLKWKTKSWVCIFTNAIELSSLLIALLYKNRRI